MIKIMFLESVTYVTKKAPVLKTEAFYYLSLQTLNQLRSKHYFSIQ